MEFVVKQLVSSEKIAKFCISQLVWAPLCDVSKHYKTELPLFSNDELTEENTQQLSQICKLLAHSCTEPLKAVIHSQEIYVATPSNDNSFQIVAQDDHEFKLEFRVEGGKIIAESFGVDIRTIMPRANMMRRIDELSCLSTQTSLISHVECAFLKAKIANTDVAQKSIDQIMNPYSDKNGDDLRAKGA